MFFIYKRINVIIDNIKGQYNTYNTKKFITPSGGWRIIIGFCRIFGGLISDQSDIWFIAFLFLKSFGIFLRSLAYLSYGMNGHGMPVGQMLGRMLESASEISFMLLVILLAKGYTVTR